MDSSALTLPKRWQPHTRPASGQPGAISARQPAPAAPVETPLERPWRWRFHSVLPELTGVKARLGYIHENMNSKQVASKCASVGLLGALSCAMACAVEDDSKQDADKTSDVSQDFTSANRTSCDVILTGCTSGWIPQANGQVVWVVQSGDSGNGCSWRVRDIDTNVVIGSGRVGAFDLQSRPIGGLVGRYHIELFSCLPGGQGGLLNNP
jgi:hypothetical protein